MDQHIRRPGMRSEGKIKIKVNRARNAGYAKSPLYRGVASWDLLGDWYHHSKDKWVFKTRIRGIADLATVTKNPPGVDDLVMD